ncbi:hypothetical protein DRZ77_01540 [Candidatus Woesearchaeota archaeon]|nr:MAG: hypothetical protein DRZ77_01540 [Candidatus Woesearchaeota archaeon]
MKLSNKLVCTVSLLIFLGLGLSLYFLRFGRFFPFGESYYLLSVAGKLSGRDLVGRELGFSLIRFVYLLPAEIIPIISIVVGSFSFVFLYLVMRRLNYKPLRTFSTLFLMVCSPSIFFLFYSATAHAFCVFFIILGIYFQISERRMIYSVICFLIGILFSPVGIVSVPLSLFIYKERGYGKRKYLLIILLAFFVHLRYLIKNLTLPIVRSNAVKVVLSDLGSRTGNGFFCIVFFLMGLYFLWKQKKRVLLFSSIVLAFFVGFYFNFLFYYISFLICWISGTGLYRFIKMRWTLKFFKRIVVGVVLFGIAFSMLTAFVGFVKSEPLQEQLDGLVWLGAHSGEDAVVLTDREKGFMIEGVANRAVVMDDLLLYTKDARERIDDLNAIFQSYSLRKTMAFLDEYNVSYIWVDREMRERIWNNEEKGLLFVLRNKIFKKEFENPFVEIYSYNPEAVEQ